MFLASPEKYFQEFLGCEPKESMICPNPEHKDTKPSFGISKDGWFNCFGCRWRGKSPLQLYLLQHPNIPIEEIARNLWSNYVEPCIGDETVERFQSGLTTERANMLAVQRAISIDVIKKRKVGFEGELTRRYTVPVYNRFGMCVDIRRILFIKSDRKDGDVKAMPYKKGFGKAKLYGVDATTKDASRAIIYCEGESDKLSVESQGFLSITNTNGVQSWNEEWARFFMGKIVIFVADTGAEEQTVEKAARVSRLAKHVRISTFDGKPNGYDVNDFILEDVSTARKRLEDLFRNSRHIVSTSPVVVTKKEVKEPRLVRFSDLVKSENYQQELTWIAFVSGKSLSPYFVMKKYMVLCSRPGESAKCKDCRYALGGVHVETKIDVPAFVKLLESKERDTKEAYFEMAGVKNPVCMMRMDLVPTEMMNVMIIRIASPPDEELDEFKEQAEIMAFLIGETSIVENRIYKFIGKTVGHYKTQQASVIITGKRDFEDFIERGKTDQSTLDKIIDTFKSKNMLTSFTSQVKSVASNIGIVGRDDMIGAFLLAYHTPAEITFKGRNIKGTADICIIGDTRTGKSATAQALVELLKLGKVVQVENSSFAGLIGGADNMRYGRWLASWGSIPCNNKRLVILDEANKLSPQDVSKMRGVRASGIAQISKISVNVSTPSNTRLVFITNPLSKLSAYSYGISCIKDFMPEPPDVARFDLIVVVDEGEVTIKEINSAGRSTHIDTMMYRERVRWCWGTKRDDIVFDSSAEEEIITVSEALAKKYSCDIPLFEADTPNKIAKLSAAVAFICASVKDGRVLVTKECVSVVSVFLQRLYDKSASEYLQYALDYQRQNKQVNERILDMNIMGTRKTKDIINKLLAIQNLTPSTIQNIFGETKEGSERITSMLVMANAIYQGKGYCYIKTEAFISYLKARRQG